MKGYRLQADLFTRLDWLEHGFSVGPSEIRDLVDPSSIVFDTEQAHGNAAYVLDGENAKRLLSGDGFIASKPGIVCHVRTADCVPVLIADTRAKVVGAIHAGWKGTALDIVGEAVKTMRDAFGTDPADCVAAIGPRICGECYEVGDEVSESISKLCLVRDWRVGDRHVDLGVANRELLERAGVPPDDIELLPYCTSCDERFVSWRRDHAPARQVSFIVIRD